MKISKMYWILLLAVGMISSCDNGFEELNSNPNDPAMVPSKLVLTNVIRMTQNIMNSTFVGGDMGSCWVQHYAKTQYNAEARYIPRESVIGNMVWQGLYASVVMDAKKMEELAIGEGNNDMQGAALILQAYGLSVLTDVFGAIPFYEALNGESEGEFTPVYDNQENVFEGILEMLDKANLLLNGTGDIDPTSDILYGGDYTRWKKMANALKFRALMRISGKVNVSTDLQDIMDNRVLFTSNHDEAKLAYLENPPNANPLFETVVFGNRNEWVMNETIIEFLESLDDPRLEIYAQPVSGEIYKGKPSGCIANPIGIDNFSPIGLKYLDAEAPGYFMSYAELQFLMAEAAQRGLISGDPESYYNEAIRASLEFNEVEEQYSEYINQPSVAYTSVNGLRKIAEQKWIALFGQGIETWTEWRRTQYPELIPANCGAISEIPSRLTYPNEEQSLNGENYWEAVNNQGPDALTTKIWWMQ